MWQASILDEAVRVEDFARLPLIEFANGQTMLEFTTPLAEGSLFLVPSARHLPDLLARGVPRGRIWLADEVRDLLLAGVGQEDLRAIIEAKMVINGFVGGATKE
jgi:hypothetical protein